MLPSPPRPRQRFFFALLATGALLTLLAAWQGAAGQYERTLYLRTLGLAVETILLAVPPATLLAWLLFATRLPGARLMLVLVAGQLFMPLYLHAAAWEAGFGRLGWYSVSSQSLDQPLLSGWTAAVWTHAVGGLGWVVMLVAAGLSSTDRHAEEAGLLEAGPLAVAARIQLPQLVPWLTLASIWIAVQVATEMTAADLYLVDTYAREIYTGFALGLKGREVFLNTLPALLVTALLAAAAITLAMTAAPAGLASLERHERRLALGRATWPMTAVTAVGLLFFFALPCGNLLYHAGLDFAHRWSLAELASSLAAGAAEFRAELYWSAVIGATTVLVVLPLATLLAAGLSASRWTGVVWVAALALLAAIPGPLIGIGLVSLFDRLPAGPLADLADRSVLGPVMAAALRTLAWSTLLMWFAWRAIPRQQLEMARLDGAGLPARFVYVIGPQLRMAWMLAGLLVFGLASSELSATLLVASPGMPTVAVRLFGLIHAGARDKEAVLALLNIAVSLLLGYGALVAGRRLLRTRR